MKTYEQAIVILARMSADHRIINPGNYRTPSFDRPAFFGALRVVASIYECDLQEVRNDVASAKNGMTNEYLELGAGEIVAPSMVDKRLWRVRVKVDVGSTYLVGIVDTAIFGECRIGAKGVVFRRNNAKTDAPYKIVLDGFRG